MTISLSRETIHLMLQSQRMIKKEFGIRIELDDDQVMARVFAYAAQSKSSELKQCANELMQQLLPASSDTDKDKAVETHSSAARVYRGQVIEQVTSAKETGINTEQKSTTKKQVIYRGQRIS